MFGATAIGKVQTSFHCDDLRFLIADKELSLEPKKRTMDINFIGSRREVKMLITALRFF